MLVQGNRIHAPQCPRTVVLWFPLGFTRSSWTAARTQCCPWLCPGVQLAECVTHIWNCPFWETTCEVPFAIPRPVGAEAGPVADDADTGDGSLPL